MSLKGLIIGPVLMSLAFAVTPRSAKYTLAPSVASPTGLRRNDASTVGVALHPVLAHASTCLMHAAPG
jgi:hypothetical protein